MYVAKLLIINIIIIKIQSSLPIPPPPPIPPIGFLKDILPPNTAVSEYRRFFASPKNGGNGICSILKQLHKYKDTSSHLTISYT